MATISDPFIGRRLPGFTISFMKPMFWKRAGNFLEQLPFAITSVPYLLNHVLKRAFWAQIGGAHCTGK